MAVHAGMRLQIQPCPKNCTGKKLCVAVVQMKCALYVVLLVAELSSNLLPRLYDAVFQELFAPAHPSNTTATSEHLEIRV